jgi:hypothetical protein
MAPENEGKNVNHDLTNMTYAGSKYRVETFLNPDYEYGLRQNIDDTTFLSEKEKEAINKMFADIDKRHEELRNRRDLQQKS